MQTTGTFAITWPPQQLQRHLVRLMIWPTNGPSASVSYRSLFEKLYLPARAGGGNRTRMTSGCPRPGSLGTRLDGNGGEWRELRVTAEATEMVTVPRAELDALRAEVRRLRREVGRSVARARMEADPGPGDAALTLSRSELAEAWGISE